ncbi:hypothetical protein [Streptomyces sp. CB02959]|uniref:hypothetical protein n=1 Tax=Streptomyces sp. CB02959 TaxID=2020330 RepID=UPI0015E0C7D1|nr:hypothetical protein [Streptomyces sp. CB02959]
MQLALGLSAFSLGLTLQFGGSSGYGFMSIEQRRQAIRELTETGSHFGGPFYIGPDGKRQWGLTTIWQHVFGDSLKYPRPRYGFPIVADPKCFNWLPVEGAEPGVEHKFLGALSERGVWVEMLRLQAGTTWSSTDPKARRITTVLAGSGECDREQISYLSTIQADAGETLGLTAGGAPGTPPDRHGADRAARDRVGPVRPRGVPRGGPRTSRPASGLRPRPNVIVRLGCRLALHTKQADRGPSACSNFRHCAIAAGTLSVMSGLVIVVPMAAGD